MQVHSTDNSQVVKRFALRQASLHRGKLALNALLITIGSAMFMTPPLMTKFIVDSVLPQKDWGLLFIVTLGAVAASFVGSAVIVLETYTTRFILRLTGQGRADLYNGFQRMRLQDLYKKSHGDLIARTMEDTTQIAELTINRIWWILWLSVTVISGSAILITLEPLLGMVIVLLWTGQTVLVFMLGRSVKSRTAKLSAQASAAMENVREIVTGAYFIKASGTEEHALASVRVSLRQELRAARGGAVTDQAVQLTGAVLGSVFVVILYAAGGWFVLQGRMPIGSLIAFAAVYNWIRPFGTMLTEAYLDAKKMTAAVDRVAGVAYPAALRKGRIPPDTDSSVAISAQGVKLVGEGGVNVLRGVNLNLEPGSVVSVIGARGSGKSSFAEVLLGLRQPTSGEVAINGVPLEDIDEGWLRGRILCVTQDVMLRSGTILDNILYGNGETDMRRIAEAVRLAELEDWIAALPKGLHTLVGEQGLIVSGGERQRISIARALLRRPAILILDEATSALDLQTEKRIIDNLLSGLPGTTLLFITHRLSVTRRSDRVLVMQEGRLEEVSSGAAVHC